MMSASYLPTKFLPPYLRPNMVHRNRLLEHLSLQPQTRLALVSAPAGYGKTTLLAAWRLALLEQGCAVAWLVLDDTDNDLQRFLKGISQALISAFQSQDAIAPDLELLALADAGSFPKLLDLLVDALAGLGRPCVLILDDYHEIFHPAIHHAVAHLLDRLPLSARLALGSRADPPLPLSRLRSRGQLVELRMADLRFSEEEVRSFVAQTLQLPLSTGDIHRLEQRTEGWVAGLQLVGLSLRNWPDWAHTLLQPGESARLVSTYLAEEVFRKLPPDIRSFLLQTSILEEMNASLCDSVWIGAERYSQEALVAVEMPDTGQDAQSILNWLERNNLFVIPLDPFGQRFRYHPLFVEFLRLTLSNTLPEAVPALHLKASRWYWRQGAADLAIRHAAECGDQGWFIHLVEQSAIEMIARSEIAPLGEWLERIPAAIFQANPYLAVIYAWVYTLLGRFNHVEAYLELAEAGQNSQSPDWKLDIPGYSITPLMIGWHIDTLRALLARARSDWTVSVRLSEQVLSALPADEQMLRSVLVFNLSRIYQDQFEVEKCRYILAQAVESGQAGGNLYIQLVSLVTLGQMSVLQGRMGEAEEYYARALRVGYRPDGRIAIPAVSFAEAWLGDWRRLQNQLERAAEHLEKSDPHR